jgi:hypothetical protein
MTYGLPQALFDISNHREPVGAAVTPWHDELSKVVLMWAAILFLDTIEMLCSCSGNYIMRASSDNCDGLI